MVVYGSQSLFVLMKQIVDYVQSEPYELSFENVYSLNPSGDTMKIMFIRCLLLEDAKDEYVYFIYKMMCTILHINYVFYFTYK